MKNTIKVTLCLNATLVFIVLFYSTSLIAGTFKETFNDDLSDQLTVNTFIGSVQIVNRIGVIIKNKYNEADKYIIA